MTRCKVGDLVVIVKTHEDHRELLGRFAFIVSADAPGYWELDLKKWGSPVLALDDYLRPIRDNPGADESLDWAPVPSIKEPA